MTDKELQNLSRADLKQGNIVAFYYNNKISVKRAIALPVISEWRYDGLKTVPCRYSGPAFNDSFGYSRT